MYLGQAIGSFIAVSIMEKIGDIYTMAWGAVICIPYITSLILPAFKDQFPDNNNWYFSQAFVYIIIIVFSMLNGMGEGMA